MKEIILLEKFLCALVAENSLTVLRELGDVAKVFTYVPTAQAIWYDFEAHVKKYGTFPQADAYEAITGSELEEPEDNAKYWFDKLVEQHLTKAIVVNNLKASDLLKESKPREAFSLLEGMVRESQLDQMQNQLFDYKHAHDHLKRELILKKDPNYGIDLGWKTMDRMLGGARGGDVISMVGRTGEGKSMLMLCAALHMWKTQGKIPLFVSMEMDVTVIFERLAAIDQKIPYNWIKHGDFATLHRDKKKDFLDALKKTENSKLPPFHVVDGNLTSSVDDIRNLCSTLKPDAVFVDGAYLLQSKDGFKAHEKIGNTARALKKLASSMHVPVFPSWQLNREVTKLRKNQQAGVEHVSGSDEIPQISSLLFRVYHDKDSNDEFQRTVQIMKGRSGESGSFVINWNFRKMLFDEVEPIADNEVQES